MSTETAWHACSDTGAHRAKTDALCQRRVMLHEKEVLLTLTSEKFSLEVLKALELPVLHSAPHPLAGGEQRMLCS